MKLIKSTKANINYLAKVIDITNFLPHPNAERMKIAQVGGYKVCVGIDEPAGRYVYFPVNSEINPNLLSYCNLYRHTEKNANTEKAGFFNDNGRVTAIKLRGFPSEGFLLPYEQLENFIADTLNLKLDNIEDNTDFDIASEGNKEFWICKKYIVVRHLTQGQSGSGKRQKNISRFNKVIDTQFHFHYDTVRIQNDKWAIAPNDLISLSEKIHGTSGISTYVLCKKRPTIWNKIKGWFGSENTYYDYLYASRTVVKNAFGVVESIHPKFINSYSILNKFFSRTRVKPINKGGYCGCDIWAEADKIVRPHLQKGMTIYYEIVGFLPTGGYIQKNYDYGCVPPEKDESFTHEKHFKVRVYRITITNVDGYVHEFSAKEVQEWCKANDLIPVTEYYYGYAKDLYNIPIDDNWTDAFWDTMANDKNFYMECNSPSCINKVPHEGLVIKKEDMRSRAWKLKCFAFLNGEQKELDAGIENIEDNA